MLSLRISFYLFISTICLCLAHPSQDVYSSLSPITENYDTEEYRNRGIQQARQNAFLTTVGSALAPIIGTLFAPLISQLASAITNAISGKLPGTSALNGTKSYNYDAYLIEMPNSPGPYLFLTNPTADNNNNNDKPNTQLPSSLQFSQSETSPSVKSPPSSSTSSFPNLELKKSLTKQYIGTIKIKSIQELSNESNSDKTTELRILDTPSYGLHFDDVIVRRERQTKELN
ncbi:uncharacterized protein LOC142331695 [Lycorma delicatula]|uniref:uncharacterized protein LOC142331695 n=1 Tax=Lycorma delicatula TaxID=130591 RepID=UPI003F510E34